jgi:hypothetical protein
MQFDSHRRTVDLRLLGGLVAEHAPFRRRRTSDQGRFRESLRTERAEHDLGVQRAKAGVEAKHSHYFVDFIAFLPWNAAHYNYVSINE